ncbi:ABC transporter ATP-binding protein [Sulfurimonas sp.]|uniref:ABC transporter ATP-binding protein n=1 Tax=Sulfurimonas sp. TaxID=2022749 RepID=UPI0025E624B3|nr:ABC transporter ATP-binding protein [Sulfurimonas sp.]
MIQISNISKSFSNTKALNNLSLNIKEGSVFGLLGVNGAGKTTLLSILNGLVDIDSGDIKIFGYDLKKQKKDIKKISSIIPQHLAFYEKLTVKENLDFFADIQNAKKEDYEKALQVNSLEKLLNQKASSLSGGQKRRLNIAIGLLNNPKIIYFDEPTVGLDPKSRNEILDSIKNYKKLGITVIYTSHYMTEIEKICDEVAIIDHGELLIQDTLFNLLSNKISDIITIEIVYQEIVDSLGLSVKNSSFIETKEGELFNTINLLKKNNISIKQIKYASTNLEKYFLDITGSSDA